MDQNAHISLIFYAKDDYTDHLCDLIVPAICEGISSLYENASRVCKKYNRLDSIIVTFQKSLQTIANWDKSKIEQETMRIKKETHSEEYLDDLIKSVIKANIIVLTHSNSIPEIIATEFYDKFDVNDFIHMAYVECSKISYTYAYIFYKEDVPAFENRKNINHMHELFIKAVNRAIRKCLPHKYMLKEFLKNAKIVSSEKQPAVQLMDRPYFPAPPIMNSIVYPVAGNDTPLKQPIQTKNIEQFVAQPPQAAKKEINEVNEYRRQSEQQEIKELVSMHKLIDSKNGIDHSNKSQTDTKIINLNAKKNMLESTTSVDDKTSLIEASSETTISSTISAKISKRSSTAKNNRIETETSVRPANLKLIETFNNKKF